MNNLWDKLSNLGVPAKSKNELREVVLLNKLIVVAAITILFFIPIEVSTNGLKMVKYELGIILFCGFVLWLNKQQKYSLAKYSFFIVTSLTIVILGIGVGGNTHNEFMLLCIMAGGPILFKKKKQYMTVGIFTILLFFAQRYLVTQIDPFIEIPLEVRLQVQPVFVIMTFCLIFFEIYYFRNLNYEYQKVIEEQKKEVEDANEELNQQNEEITAQRDLIEQQKMQVEDAHNEIKDSINYAKRIQNAILPSDEILKEYLPNSFVLYKPKDVVAGDFYWLEKIENNILFAAADCTGHGVPGAMVSVVCHNAMNRAVREFKLSEPGLILDKTRNIVLEELSHSNDNVQDGMDIAFCSLNKNTLKYSGANNPLWIIRNNDLIEIKADKQPVGKFENPKPFTTHSIDLQKNDLICIFSDGFSDQFGGPKDKKFGSKQLKNLLISINGLTIEEQKKTLESTFYNWMKQSKEEQLDDVCLFVINISSLHLFENPLKKLM